jgi:hypothetical protein
MRHPLTLACAVVFLVCFAAEATVILPLPFETVVRESTVVLVGTARSQKVVEGGPPQNLLFTDVTFDGLTVLKGRVEGKTVTLRFAGGVGKDRRVVVVGVPRFVTGRRYVLFVNPAAGLCPTVGWWHGLYRLRKDVDSGDEIVCDAHGRAVYGFAGGLPVTRPPEPGAKPVRIAAFADHVREIVAAQAAEGEAEVEDDDTGTPPEEGGR